MNDKKHLEEQLADMTDTILDGKHLGSFQVEELQDEIRVVKLLKETIDPTEEVSPAFRQRMTQNVLKEWDKKQTRHNKIRRLPFGIGVSQLLSAAAALAIVVTVLLFSSESLTGTSVENTSNDPITMLVPLAIVASIMICTAFLYYLTNRK